MPYQPLDERRARFEFVGPLWLIEGLKQLSRREHKSMTDLLRVALLEKYPELREMRGGFVSRVLARRRAGGEPGQDPAAAPIGAPGGSTE